MCLKLQGIHNGKNERQRANGVFTYAFIYAYENLLRLKYGLNSSAIFAIL